VRIVLVALGIYADEGGIERVNRRILRSLAELPAAAHELHAVAFRDIEPDTHDLPAEVAFHSGGRSRPRTILAFARTVARTRPEVVVYSHVMLVPLVWIARVLSPRSRHVLLAHGIEVWDRPSRFARLTVRRGVDVVAAVSRHTARRMAVAYGLPAGRFRILAGATDVREDGAADGSMPAHASNGPPRLLTVSRLAHAATHKNVDKVLRALPGVLRSHPQLRYTVVGDGDWRPDLERLSREIGVDDHVEFTGNLPDEERDALYETSTAFVLPSTGEGFGLVYLEAWDHGLPVLVATEGAAPELVDDGITGVCVDPEPAAIADGLLTLLRDRAASARMGRAGHDLVHRRYSHAQFRERLRRVIDEQRARRLGRRVSRRAAGEPARSAAGQS